MISIHLNIVYKDKNRDLIKLRTRFLLIQDYQINKFIYDKLCSVSFKMS